jgi:molybdopterin converting factor small subunit
LAHYTRGVTELEVEATTVRGVIRVLEAQFAGIGRELEEGMAVAIDSTIHQDDLFAPIKPDSEVCFLPRIGGG